MGLWPRFHSVGSQLKICAATAYTTFSIQTAIRRGHGFPLATSAFNSDRQLFSYSQDEAWVPTFQRSIAGYFKEQEIKV